MQVITRAAQAPLTRSGVGKQAIFVVVGVVGVAGFLRRIRKRSRHQSTFKAIPDGEGKQGKQAVALSDTSTDWASEASPMPPAEVQTGDLLLLDEELPLTPKQLWKLIYDLTFIQRFYQKKGFREVGIGGWQKTGDHTCGKTSHFITPVKKNVLGPSEAYTEEEYICQRRGSSGFSVQVFAYTRKVPYGGSFHVELKWTATRISATTTRLQVVGSFVPEKRMLGVAGIIKNATHEGLQDTYKLYRQHLWDAINSGHPQATERVSRKIDGGPSPMASAVTKEAAEDLVRNGVFVSWAQLIGAFFMFFCMVAVARLAMDRGSRSGQVQHWKAEYQRATHFLRA